MNFEAKTKKKLLETKAEQVFEIAWEACNKVGGIYTVLVSKTALMLHHYQRANYFLIGPYFPERVKGEFEEEKAPPKLKQLFARLAKDCGLVCHFGKWLIEGEPQVILLDFRSFWREANQIKGKLWQDFQIDSLAAGSDFTEPVIWAYGAGILLEAIARAFPQKKIAAHFHEWLSGAGLLYLKKNQVKMGLVFTTHATTLGRTLAFHCIDLYSTDALPLREAEKYNIKAKYQLEMQSAKQCDVFSTVSIATGLEAEKFLERRPDIILPNGLDARRFLSFDELIIKHRLGRSRLNKFLLFYFFPYYTFDLNKTLFYFITGRYEARAKGIDIFIKALGELNKKLVENRSKKTIVSFLWIPAKTSAVRSEIIENKQFFEDIKDSLEDVKKVTEEKLLSSLTEGRPFSEGALFSRDFLFEIKKKLARLKRQGLPPLSTHLLSDKSDYILKTLEGAGLTNKKEDRVKVVFYPTYLSGHDGLSDLNYQESIEACHLGAFPSFYEPWGYTPLETAGAGVAAVTTDAAGFGRFVQKLLAKSRQPGIFILKRLKRTDQEAISDLAEIFWRFSNYSHRQRVDNKIEARRIAAFADWRNLIKNYLISHNIAIDKVFKK